MRNGVRNAVLGALLAVGFTSLWLQIRLNDEITTIDAALALGVECLKAALFFILLDYIIARNEKLAEESKDAKFKLQIGDWGSGEEFLTQLDKIVRRGKITLNLSGSTKFNDTDLTVSARHFIDSAWTQSDFTGVSFDNVTFENMVITNASFRGSIISNSKFKKCTFNSVDCKRTRFIECQFEDILVENPIFDDAVFTNCSMPKELSKTLGLNA